MVDDIPNQRIKSRSRAEKQAFEGLCDRLESGQGYTDPGQYISDLKHYLAVGYGHQLDCLVNDDPEAMCHCIQNSLQAKLDRLSELVRPAVVFHQHEACALSSLDARASAHEPAHASGEPSACMSGEAVSKR